jgi:predicted GIY-YIG superfamily endonuclease
MREAKRFYVYIMTNRPRSHVLYTGVTGNLARRVLSTRTSLYPVSQAATTSRGLLTTSVSLTPMRLLTVKKRSKAGAAVRRFA